VDCNSAAKLLLLQNRGRLNTTAAHTNTTACTKPFLSPLPSQPELPPIFFSILCFYHFLLGFLVCFFFAYQVSSTIDAWHIFKSSYDETINKLLVSSYEPPNICQASIIDFTLLCKKHISKVFTFQHFSL